MPPHHNILIAVMGESPAILTETVWYFAAREDIAFDQIRVITTSKGRDDLLRKLLPPGGPWERLCRLFPGHVPELSAESILVLPDEDGCGLTDIRTARHSELAVDFVGAEVRRLTEDEHCSLYASIAGGRKTMGVSLYAAMMLFGRLQDRVFHVLLDPRVENDFKARNQFYFPEGDLPLESGERLPAAEISIEVAEVPWLPLPGLVQQIEKQPYSRKARKFNALPLRRLIEEQHWRLQLEQNPLPLEIDVTTGLLRVGNREVKLSERHFLCYLIVADFTSRGESVDPLDLTRSDPHLHRLLLQAARRDALLKATDAPEQQQQDLEQEALHQMELLQLGGRDSRYTELLNEINESLQRVLGDAPLVKKLYGLRQERGRGTVLGLPAEQIHIRWWEPLIASAPSRPPRRTPNIGKRKM